ncbi:MAG: VIT1/CCC1 transporter family protein [Candidatus Aenigmatarchaeota archaeon]
MRHINREHHLNIGSKFRDFILGCQDGLVNVLGIVLGIVAATQSTKLIIISGLAATFAESISMAAVAFTSMKASMEFYNSERRREESECKTMPQAEKDELRRIYFRKGFRGKLLDSIVSKLTSNRKLWIDTMMEEELRMFPEKMTPAQEALIVGSSAFVGSFIPLVPFMLFPVSTAVTVSLIVSTITLFIIGVIKSKLGAGKLLRSGIEMAVIGMVAAVVGYFIGLVLGVSIS